MYSPIDLHVHSTASDGRKTPAEVIALAAARQLQLLALTDHDTTQGWVEARARAEALGLRLIAGVEINTDSQFGEAHVLGYFANPENVGLQSALNELREKRLSRAQAIIEKLNALNIPLTLDQVRAGDTQTVITRSHIGQALAAAGYAANKPAAFELYLGQGRPAYVPRYAFTPQQAIEIIRAAGGVASLAHPFRSGNVDHLPALVEMGLGAVEVYYYDHSSADVTQLRALAEKYRLLCTGGSDFHEELKGGRRTLGSVWVPEADGEKLWQAVFKSTG